MPAALVFGATGQLGRPLLARLRSAGWDVVAVSRDAIEVATGHGWRLAIERLQSEGKRPMEAREFLAGRALHPGARFTGP